MAYFSKRVLILIGGILGLATLSLVYFFSPTKNPSQQSKFQDHEKEEDTHHHEEEKMVTLTPEQIKIANFTVIKITPDSFKKRLSLPAEVSLNENKITHVVSPIPGVVHEIFKNLGDEVKTGELLATLKSREMAEAKAVYIAAHKEVNLKEDLYKREEQLVKQKLRPETEFLKTRNAYETAKIDLDQKKQKLIALGMTEEHIQNLPTQDGPLNIYNIESPINGKIIERHLTSGEIIASDKQIFTLANLDTVWINLSINSTSLPSIKKGQKVDVLSQAKNLQVQGEILYVSPVINEETRTGRAIVELQNANNIWNPGDFVTAHVIIDEKRQFLSIPKDAIQKIEGENMIFIKTSDTTFKAEKVTPISFGQSDAVEIKEALKEGLEIVTKNSFLLKAELGKSEAEHAH